jgi:hypothetical protein
MNLLLSALLVTTLLPLTVVLAYNNNANNVVILKQGVKLQAGKTLRTPNRACSLTLQRDGNLIARRRGPFWSKPGTFDPVPSSISWTSGAADNQGDYYVTLTPDGNLQVRNTNNDIIVFTTHVHNPNTPNAAHQLVFTEKCALRVMRKEANEDFATRVWTNIHEWLDNFSAFDYPGLDNVLQRGEYFSYPGHNFGTACSSDLYCVNVPYTLYLQHDCNLVTRVGHDAGDADAVVWSAGVAHRNVEECYLLVDSHDVALYEGSFDPSLPEDATRLNKYWSVPRSFFDVDSYNPGGYNSYQILLNGNGEMILDWD